MTEIRQHQQPIQHALDAADHAILQAQHAEHKLQVAIKEANPQAIQTAQAALVQSKHKVIEAQEQLQSFNNEQHGQYGQQLKQTLEQIAQASQDIDANQVKFHTPKQIR